MESKVLSAIKKVAKTAYITRDEEKPTTRVLDVVITLSIALTFFLVPLFFSGLVAQGMGFEKMTLFYFLVLLGTVAWVTKGVVLGELNLKRTPLDLPIMGLVIVYVIATIFSVNTKDSLIGSYGDISKGLAAMFIFSLFYYLVVNNINTKKIKILFWCLVGSISLVSVYSLLQLFGIFILPMAFTKIVSFNTVGSLSSLTMAIALAIPLYIIALTQTCKIHPGLKDNFALLVVVKVLTGIGLIASAVVLALLNGFVYWPIAIVGVVVLLMFFLSKIITISSNNLIIPLGVFLFLIIFLVLGSYTVKQIDLPTEVSLSRGISWDIAKESMKKNPFFGSGPATYYYDFSLFKSENFNASPLWNVRFNNATGFLFELMSTVGILGALAMIILALTTLSMCFLTLTREANKEVRSILLGLLASYIMVLLFSVMFAMNNSVIIISVLVSVLGVSTAVAIYPEKFKELKLSFRAAPKYALSLAAIFLCVSAGVVILFTMGLKMYLADNYALKAIQASEINDKIALINKAIVLFPYEDSYYIDLANFYMAVANQEVSGGNDQGIIQNNLAMAIDAAKMATELAPNKASNHESNALIYENAAFYSRGALELSEDHYNKLAALDPANPIPSLRIALINMARSNAEEDPAEKNYYIEEAIKKYDEAISKKGDLSSAYYGKAIAYEKLNDLDKSLEQLGNAVLLDKTNIDYRFELGRLYFNRGVSQPNLSQTASKELTEESTVESPVEGDSVTNNLSVETGGDNGGEVKANEDLQIAEQLFLSIYQANPNHANSVYSLALLYQKIGNEENAKKAVQTLLNIVQDEAARESIKEQFPGLYE